MAYDATKPTDDEYLSVFPAEMREQLRAIIQDAIVNALTVKGYSPGNLNGNIPVSNGNLNANLNADKLDGYDATYFSASGHVHAAATQSTNGFMSNTDKMKVDGIATGAEVNQNAFSNVAVGSTTIQADSKTDTLTLAAGANIEITPDATNDKVTVAVTGTVPTATTANSCTGNSATAETANSCTGNSATASKLSTARKINITGNATGAADFDGSGDVSINTTVNESEHAAVATTVYATVPNGGVADLAFGIMADNDSARIRVGGSNDNGWLEIATSDNGNESIYVRQYSGNFPQDAAKSITNEAVLLDSNGNTKFPHNVTAASFTGPLNGNADTATNADKLDGYHASDIINSITAANTGGIVAASLTGNGYVKFANGLILQWGYGGAKTHVTFPIAFTSFARIVCTCDSGNWVWVNSPSITGFSVWSDGGAYWLAVGM